MAMQRTALPALPLVASIGAQSSRAGAVQPSLASAVSWMRLCVAQQPRLRLQVRLPCTPQHTYACSKPCILLHATRLYHCKQREL